MYCAFEVVITGKKLAIGTGNLMHPLGLFHGVAGGAPEAPQD